jgi:hypothetical protein
VRLISFHLCCHIAAPDLLFFKKAEAISIPLVGASGKYLDGNKEAIILMTSLGPTKD